MGTLLRLGVGPAGWLPCWPRFATGRWRLPDVADVPRRHGSSQWMIGSEHAVVPMPVFSWRRDQIRKPICFTVVGPSTAPPTLPSLRSEVAPHPESLSLGLLPCASGAESPLIPPRPELFAQSSGPALVVRLGFAQVDWTDPFGKATYRPITPRTPENDKKHFRYTHGAGTGDIDGDGRIDILTKDGWFEQPESIADVTISTLICAAGAWALSRSMILW